MYITLQLTTSQKLLEKQILQTREDSFFRNKSKIYAYANTKHNNGNYNI